MVLLIAPVRAAFLWEREVAAKETEAAKRLLALNELREAALRAREQVGPDGTDELLRALSSLSRESADLPILTKETVDHRSTQN